MRTAVGLIAVLLLMGCAAGLDYNPSVTASIKQRPENQFSLAATVIRSTRVNADGKTEQFGGAICSGGNALVSFSGLVTPAVVQMPSYLQAERFKSKGKPPALTVTCRAEGKTARFTIEPTAAVDNVTTTSGGTFNETTGTYSQPTNTRLTSRLSSTLPWRYPEGVAEF